MQSLRELLAHREVLAVLVWRDLKTRYRGSVLGFLWTLLNPLLLMGIYSLVFSVYIRVAVPHYPIYVFAGLLSWHWFSSALLASASSIIDGGGLIKRVAFPPQILPTVSVLATLVNFALALPLLFAFVLGAGLPLGRALVVLPALVLIQGVFTLGLGVAISMLSVQYRDLQPLLGNLLTLWFFVTPVVYPASFVPERFRPLLWLNPMAGLVAAYQDVLYHGRLPAAGDLAPVAVTATLVGALALVLSDRLRWSVVEQV